MPSSYQLRKTANERIAREKALHTYVCISGVSGHHPLETGLAYYYRGHYIYAYPAGNLIEPIPYSTRKGITIQGIVSESAPGYDCEAAGLVEEESIRALAASIESGMMAKSDSEEDNGQDLSSPDEAMDTSMNLQPPSHRVFGECMAIPLITDSLHLPLTSYAAARDPAPSPSTFTVTFTPQPGLSFLAASEPGSRLASRSTSPCGLRPTSSHVGLVRLGGRLGGIQENATLLSKTGDGSESAEKSKGKMAYLPGLGDHALDTQVLRRLADTEAARSDLVNGAAPARVRPCALHGESCDGVATERLWNTEEMRLGRGFVEDMPMVDNGGRVMIDWVRLLEEARSIGL